MRDRLLGAHRGVRQVLWKGVRQVLWIVRTIVATVALMLLATPSAAQVTVDQQTSNAATNTTQHNFSFTCTAGRPFVVLVALNPHAIATPIVSVVYDPAGSNVSLTSAGAAEV